MKANIKFIATLIFAMVGATALQAETLEQSSKPWLALAPKLEGAKADLPLVKRPATATALRSKPWTIPSEREFEIALEPVAPTPAALPKPQDVLQFHSSKPWNKIIESETR